MHLIPNATNTKAVALLDVGAGDTGIVVVQPSVPSGVRIGLCTTPPGTEVANVDVCTNDVAVTAREACESAFVRSLLVG